MPALIVVNPGGMSLLEHILFVKAVLKQLKRCYKTFTMSIVLYRPEFQTDFLFTFIAIHNSSLSNLTFDVGQFLAVVQLDWTELLNLEAVVEVNG